jgi:hypothetical protein
LTRRRDAREGAPVSPPGSRDVATRDERRRVIIDVDSIRDFVVEFQALRAS